MSRPILEYITPSLLERFWSKVDNGCLDECWEWQGGQAAGGYGVIACGRARELRRAPRISWVIANNQEIPDGFHVLHACDNPPCVNPAHLSVGTQKKNMQGASKRGRLNKHAKARGIAQHMATVPDEVALQSVVRILRRESLVKEEGARLGIDPASCGKWVRGTSRPNLIEKAVWLA